MALADAWLTAVLDAGGDVEPPPSPQIPADYLQKPRRRHPPCAQALLPSSLLPSPPTSLSTPKQNNASLTDINPPNDSRPPKRQRMLNAPTPVMSPAQPSPSNISDTKKAPDPNATPRPVRTRRRPAPALDETAMPALTPSVSKDELGTTREDMERPASSVTETTGSKARSRSPTKRMVDLQVAEKTVALKSVKSPADIPEDVQGLYKAVRGLVVMPRGVIPLGIEDEVKNDAAGDLDLDNSDLLVAPKANSMTREQLMDEFKALRRVRDSTALCIAEQVHEPAWNELVHSRMLEQAVQNHPGLRYHNITTARVIKQLVPGNKYGELLKNKMIDYAITLGPSTLGPPLLSEDQVITRLATSLGPLQRTINPSSYSPLCYNPVAISIETKSPDGSKENGEVQLSVWAMAYFNRLRALTQNPVSITLPLILISGQHWKLMFARDLEDSIEIIHAAQFGNTEDIVGCYKILAVLRLLCGWAEGTFLSWFSNRVLNPE